MTGAQLEASTKPPCTRTTVGDSDIGTIRSFLRGCECRVASRSRASPCGGRVSSELASNCRCGLAGRATLDVERKRDVDGRPRALAALDADRAAQRLDAVAQPDEA